MKYDTYAPEVKDYRFFDMQCKDKFNRRLIDGQITGCGNCDGYCQYSGHSGFLNKKQIEQHKCVEKGCFYFLQKQKSNNKTIKDNLSSEILSSAKKKAENLEGVKLLKAEMVNDICQINYITITNVFLLKGLDEFLIKKYGIQVKFRKLEYDFDRVVEIMYA